MPSSRLPARLSPRPVRTVARRIAAGPFVAHLRLNGGLLAGCLLVLSLALTVALLTRGQVVTWDGVHEVPELPLLTGTDAGLLPADAGR